MLMDSATMREEPYCPECGKGADYIVADATAQWDVIRQIWELIDVQEAFFCTNCDANWSSHMKWRNLDADETSVSSP